MENDYEKVLKFWGPMEEDYRVTGELVTTCFFTNNPHLKKHFPKFENIAPADMAGHTAVIDYGVLVLEKLGQLLRAKGNQAAILKPLAISHATKHKIPLEHFAVMTEAIIKVMEKKTGLDAAGGQALRNVMKTVVADMDVTYKELKFQG